MKRLALAAFAGVLVFGLWTCTRALESTDDGEAVSVFGPWLGADADAFSASTEMFADNGGGDVRYTGSLNFDVDLRNRVAGAVNAPAVAAIPQPGLINELVEQNQLVPFSDDLVASLLENFPSEQVQQTPDGEVFVLPYRSIVKSLVWYRPDVFEQEGWAIPETLTELATHVDDVQASGTAPWCFGVFSGADTGWPATDWVEDLLLRRAGVDIYDEWVSGEREFDDPEVRGAFEFFDRLVLAQGRTAGGLSRVLEGEINTISAPLFDEEPGCAMYKQASFTSVWFPDGTTIGPDGDVDFFMLPGDDGDEPAPVLVSGDGVVQLADRPAVDGFLQYLASPDGAREWAALGGYLSARSSVESDDYYQPTDQRLAGVFLDGRETRFDGSDQFPSTIRDLFLDEITNWIAGSTTYDEMATRLDDARAQLTSP